MRTLTRREVLVGALVLGAALAPGGARLARQVTLHAERRGPEALARDLAARIEDLGADAPQLRAIGTRYLEGRPTVTAGGLVAGVAPSGVLPANLLAMDGGDLRAALQRRATEDFRGGRVVDLDGWLLGAGEARLCALVALAGRGQARVPGRAPPAA